jgi:hypothetical protein
MLSSKRFAELMDDAHLPEAHLEAMITAWTA